MFFSDYKPTIDDLGKKIIGASFDVDSNELLIYFGLVVRNNVETTGNSIYDI